MPEGAHEAGIVHIIDDDPSMQAALEALFRSVGLVTRTYGSAMEFLDSGTLDCVGCLVLDVRLPGIGGLDFQDQLNNQGNRLPVVLMTGHGDIPMSVRAMKAGAVDFLPKPFRDQDMLDAVSAAIERDRVRRASHDGITEIRGRFEKLSPREREVMKLVVDGKLNKQAANELGVTEITIKIHRGSAMRKMGARTFADLVRMAELLKSASE